MSLNTYINKNNFDSIFNELAKSYETLGGNKKIELYLVGGTAIVLNFAYRKSTMDVDALFNTNAILKEAIENTASIFHLVNNWLNSDFATTPSYSKEIINKAILYKVYGKHIYVFHLESKYLIAMKLKSSRPEGGDLDDIVKMIYETRLNNESLAYEDIIEAYKELYPDFQNTYESFLNKTKQAFETSLEDIEIIMHPEKSIK